MEDHGQWNFPPVLLILNCLCTFALNLSVFLVITHTSALTIRVAGVVKDWVVVLVSAVLFADTKLTIINLIGYGIGKYMFLFDLLNFLLISYSLYRKFHGISCKCHSVLLHIPLSRTIISLVLGASLKPLHI